ncbi:probable protein phosphatase 2C 30 [Andrographis paniculata]|uniref:probable protein phosphatase 2C 30 n=1 Tax=Andrographis paniculata TaxID=175694 RepID=UPI0021E8EC7F|nr:probable protein phosphatase 2C 30 [Andrographis paniculata]
MHCAVAALSSPAGAMTKLPPIFCMPVASPPRLALAHIGGGRENKKKKEEEELRPAKLAMKRKRPTRIDIPATTTLGCNRAGVWDFERSSSDLVAEVEVEGEGHSVYAKRGKRRNAIEDRYAVGLAPSQSQGQEEDSASASKSNPTDKQSFFGVFDGHGGAGAAEFAANNLEKNIRIELSSKGLGGVGVGVGVEEAVKKGYLTTDSEILKNDITGGACCVTALIHKGDLLVSNAGDCRAVMSRGGAAEALTVDHRPSRVDERQRIEALGGYVDSCSGGVWRVHGSLAVSRALGDSHLKKWVIAEPETRLIKITPDCEFLILASDGLWDKVRNQEAVDIVRSSTKTLAACKKLVDLSLTRGSRDDISVMIIHLTQFLE